MTWPERAAFLLVIPVACAPGASAESRPKNVVLAAPTGESSAPEPEPPSAPREQEPRFPTCEQAIAAYEGSDADADAGPSAGQYGAVLNRGSYLKSCNAPDTTAISICAAVRDGRVVGVSVQTDPADAALEACIAGAVRGLAFPSNPTLDVTRTIFR